MKNFFLGSKFRRILDSKGLRNIVKINDNLEVQKLEKIDVENPVEETELQVLYDIKESIWTCQDISQARSILESCEQSSSDETVLLQLVQIRDDFSKFQESDLEVLNVKCSKKPIVVLLRSTNDEKSLIYWKPRDFTKFLFLDSKFKANHEESKEIHEFIAEFLANTLSHDCTGIPKSLEESCTDTFDVAQIVDYRGFNLLQHAAESGNIEILKILLSSEKIKQSALNSTAAQTLAWKAHHFDVVFFFARSNLQFPPEIVIEKLPEDFQSFYQRTEELHEAVINRKSDKVRDILAIEPRLKYFLNSSNESAAKKALEAKFFDIYEILIANEVFFAPHEDDAGIFESLDYNEQQHVRDIHTRNSKNLPDRHINYLMAHSFLGHDVPDADENLKHIREAYEFLSRDRICNSILKVVAASKNPEIIFDFNRDCVNFVDPTTNEETEGIFYPTTGRVYIGARMLLNESTQIQARATLIHELCHYAMQLVYGNRSNPYKVNDSKMWDIFETVTMRTAQNSELEQIIDSVYEHYLVEFTHAELIVRVPHLRVVYHDQPDVLAERMKQFPELFEFFEDVTIPDMEKAIKEIKRRDEKALKTKDKTISRLSAFLCFLGILFLIGIPLTIFVTQKVFAKPEYKFSELQFNDQVRVRNGLIKYKNVSMKFNELFPPDSKAYNAITTDHIAEIFENKPLNLSNDHYLYLNKYIHHDWLNMSEKLQQKVLASNFTFQNESIKFQKLYEITPNVFKNLTSNQLVTILDGKRMTVGSMIANKTNFYVERNFIFEGDDYLDIKLTNTHDEFFDVIEKANRWRFSILSSEAGAGKTVTFEQMAIKIKKKYPTKWVSYVDLKQHTEHYNEEGNLTNLQELLEKVLNLSERNSTEFEREIFTEMYRAGQVVLLWNGFDEISPRYNKFVENVMYEIFINSTNIQFICTRPLYSEQLKLKFNMHPYQLVSFNKKEQVDFITKFLSYAKVSNLPTVVETAMRIVTKLKLNTPLMLVLVAEIHDQYEFLVNENLYKIYDTFVTKKVEIWQKKGEESQKVVSKLLTDDRFTIRHIYQKFALLSEFKSLYQGLKRIKIVRTAVPPILSYEEIASMGILYIKDEFKYDFAHRTFAEFFVAQFLYSKLYLLEEDESFDNEQIVELFHYLKFRPNICRFMIGFLDIQDKTPKKYNRKFKNLLLTQYNDMFYRFLSPAYNESYEMLFKFFGRDHDLLVDLLHIDRNETVYTAIHNPVHKSDISIKPKFKELAEQFLTPDEVAALTVRDHQKGIELFGATFLSHFAKGIKITNDKYLLDFHEAIKSELNDEEQKALHLFLMSNTELLYQINTFSVDYYLQLWEKGEAYFNETDTDKIAILSNAMKGVTTLAFWAQIQKLENVTNFIFRKAMDYLTPEEIREIFIREKFLYRATNYQPVMDSFWALYTNYTDEATQKQALLDYDSWGEVKYCKEDRIRIIYMDTTQFVVFHYGLFIPYKSGGTFPTLEPIYNKIFTPQELQEMILKSNSFLINMLRTNDGPTCEEFSLYLLKIFAGNEKELKAFFERPVYETTFTISNYFVGLDFDVSSCLSVFEDKILNAL